MTFDEAEKKIEELVLWAECLPDERHDLTLLQLLRDGLFDALAAVQGLSRGRA
ncbi:MAG: hypothetical protein PHH26_05270 [Candidatus Thermoplasmatota archaeon]|nr:hypothetical protein [Candidatus Thermoplasmatota archaeon]